MDQKTLEQNFAKDLTILNALVDEASKVHLYGSYSERRPDLGKMFTCPYCRQRRLQGEEQCCTPTYSVVHDKLGKGFLKRFTHRRHGQGRRFRILQIAQKFQTSKQVLWEAMVEMRVLQEYRKAVDAKGPCCFWPFPENVLNFAERYFYWQQEQQDKKKRKRTKQSRKTNR